MLDQPLANKNQIFNPRNSGGGGLLELLNCLLSQRIGEAR